MSPVLLAAEEATQNPFLPATYDIIWATVCLVIIGVFVYRTLLPKMNAMLDERADKIEGGIARAEAVQAEADAALTEHKQLLAGAILEAAQIREHAQVEGTQIVAESRSRAKEEADRIVAAAMQEIEIERQHAVVSLRTEVGSLAVELASKIVGESLADEARRSRVIDRFLDDLDAELSAPSATGAPPGPREA